MLFQAILLKSNQSGMKRMFDDNQVTKGSFTIKNKTHVNFLEVNTIKKGYEFTLTALFFVLFDYIF